MPKLQIERLDDAPLAPADQAINEALAWWDCQYDNRDEEASYGADPSCAVPIEEVVAAKLADHNGAFCVEDVRCIVEGTRVLAQAAITRDYSRARDRFNDTVLAFSIYPSQEEVIRAELHAKYGVSNGPIYHMARLVAAGTLNTSPYDY